jgi:hypothetical protein
MIFCGEFQIQSPKRDEKKVNTYVLITCKTFEKNKKCHVVLYNTVHIMNLLVK